jgi:hypothetical protein
MSTPVIFSSPKVRPGMTFIYVFSIPNDYHGLQNMQVSFKKTIFLTNSIKILFEVEDFFRIVLALAC